MLTRRHILAGLALAPVLGTPAFAREPAFYQEGGVAIDGSDPVAYFDMNGPVAGSSAHTLSWRGVEWRFASAENMAKFEADPERFAPQFGGYCAWAVSQGYTASTTPEAWTIHEGKLYLNFSKRIQRRWERDIPGNVAKGEANWPSVLG